MIKTGYDTRKLWRFSEVYLNLFGWNRKGSCFENDFVLAMSILIRIPVHQNTVVQQILPFNPCKQVRMTFEFQFRYTSASTWWLTVACVWPWTPSTTVDGVTWPISALVTRSVRTSGWIEMIPARIPKYSGYRYVFLSHALKWTNKFCLTDYFEFFNKNRPLNT